MISPQVTRELKMIEDWKSAHDKQMIIGAVTIDLSKNSIQYHIHFW